METATQLSLPLFDPPRFDELLHRYRGRHVLTVSVNNRLRRSWQVRTSPISGRRTLVIPAFLAAAPEEIKICLIEWALFPCRPARSRLREIREQRRLLEKKIWHYIESLSNTPRRTSRFDPGRFSGTTQGTRYDLREVFDAVNASSFNGTLHSLVRWGEARSKTSYHTTRTDRQGVRHDLITIAGLYNHPEIPRFAIEAIMHHEMLHIAVAPYRKNGRAVIHGKEFKTEEKKFKWFLEWRKWEKEEFPKLLRRKWFRRRPSLPI